MTLLRNRHAWLAIVVLVLLITVAARTSLQALRDHRARDVTPLVTAFLRAMAAGDTATVRSLMWQDSVADRYIAREFPAAGFWHSYATAKLSASEWPRLEGDTAFVVYATHPRRLRCIDVPGPDSHVVARLVRDHRSWLVEWVQLEPTIC
jgi:hypothetical protein